MRGTGDEATFLPFRVLAMHLVALGAATLARWL